MKLFILFFLLFMFGLPGLWAKVSVDSDNDELKRIRAEYDAKLRENMMRRSADELQMTQEEFQRKEAAKEERDKNIRDACGTLGYLAGFMGGTGAANAISSLPAFLTGGIGGIAGQLGDVFSQLWAKKEQKEQKEQQEAYLEYLKENYPEQYQKLMFSQVQGAFNLNTTD